MQIERTKNATRNIVFGVVLKVYQILFPFVIRTVMIRFMGVQYLGLNSLFTSILHVLNLAELGVGVAMTHSMYKPIAEDNTEEMCALLRLYSTYYNIIGVVITTLGLILAPFIRNLISGDVPEDINIYVLYFMNVFATACSYWLMAYRSSILQAHQRVDIISKITLITNTIQYIFQIVVLIFLHNYYLYVVLILGGQVLTNIMTAIATKRLYPVYVPRGNLNVDKVKEINKKIRDLFTARLGGVVVGSADTIVISAFLGLKTLAIYQNYYFILNAICGFMSVLFTSVTAGIGNSLIVDEDEKKYSDFKLFTFIICWILCICTCCFAGLYQPFMQIWVGEELMLGYEYVILFCILFYVLELSLVWATVKDAAGLWHADRFRPLIGAIANLALNLFLVQRIGLYGIIISTILSYVLITMPWLVYNVFTYLYKDSLKEYIGKLFTYIIMTVLSVIVSVLLCNQIQLNGVIALVVNFVICLIVSNGIQYVVFGKTQEFVHAKKLVFKMIGKGSM